MKRWTISSEAQATTAFLSFLSFEKEEGLTTVDLNEGKEQLRDRLIQETGRKERLVLTKNRQIYSQKKKDHEKVEGGEISNLVKERERDLPSSRLAFLSLLLTLVPHEYNNSRKGNDLLLLLSQNQFEKWVRIKTFPARLSYRTRKKRGSRR